MQKKIPLVIATRNPGKTAEIRDLLTGFPVEIKNLDDFGPLPVVEEDGKTFAANAYKKASFTAKILGIPALADDSGLVVEALDGAPGVLSARYAGENATDEQRCAKLLKEMAGKANRRAAFECVLSIAAPSGPALTYDARCEGLIAERPAGQNGFGYDPIFFYPPLKKTFAQLTREEKGRVSHRGRALNEMKQEFDRVLTWIRRHMPLGKKCYTREVKMIAELVKENRSCRRFHEDHSVALKILEDLVDLARLSASSANLQPLKYILACQPEINAEIFSCLAWAGYLKDWPGPEAGERPAAYVVILGDTKISKDFGCDHGIAAQSILLGAREKGLAGCMLGSVNRKALRKVLSIESHLQILLVLAIGKPKEKIAIETVGPDGSIRYWRDAEAVHHVPKRALNDMIVASHGS